MSCCAALAFVSFLISFTFRGVLCNNHRFTQTRRMLLLGGMCVQHDAMRLVEKKKSLLAGWLTAPMV